MSYFMAIFLGLVQGIAEFLPISSSGHLSLLQHFFGVQNVENDHLFFSVLLHLGTLISVCIVYRKDVVDMIREFCLGVGALFLPKLREKNPPPARRLVLMVILGTLPLLVILPIKGVVEALYTNTVFIGFALIVTGFILYLSDQLATGRKTIRNMTVKDALLIGCGQAVAVVPGLSRSGATIASGMTCGLERNFAVRFSFLLSLPAILGANILSLSDAVKAGIDVSMLPKYIIGTVVAAVAGYFAIRLVKELAQKGKFGGFAWYCWGVGILAIVATFVFQ
ncbi:MAG: undecaprenyl-diphosphate phosphatase [Oscillospiraceae bacterium]|nr:undecaprenyl-diphosphate phosphatase [Oscillospiraceae bacterium]